jgi:hypothetical protein
VVPGFTLKSPFGCRPSFRVVGASELAAGSTLPDVDVDESEHANAGPRPIAMPFDRIAHLSASQRELFERVLAVCGHDREDVLEVRVSEVQVEVDIIDFDLPDWPVRTVRCSGAWAATDVSGRTRAAASLPVRL